MLGIYEIELVDDALSVTAHLVPGAEQLSLPDDEFMPDHPASDPAESLLTPFDRDIFEKATAGQLPCPCCGEPLLGQPTRLAGEPTIQLFCPDSRCGFEEV